MAPDTGISHSSGWPGRDAAGNNGAKGTDSVGIILDARREGAASQKPAGSDRGEAAGWTSGAGLNITILIRQKAALVIHDDSAEAVASACRVLNKRSIVIPGRRRLG